MSDARDIGAVIAEVLSSPGHEGQSYDLTGPELLSFDDAAKQFSEVLGREITYVNMPLDSYMDGLRPLLINQWHVDAVSDLFAEIANGNDLGQITNTTLLGRPATSLHQFIEDHKVAFS